MSLRIFFFHLFSAEELEKKKETRVKFEAKDNEMNMRALNANSILSTVFQLPNETEKIILPGGLARSLARFQCHE